MAKGKNARRKAAQVRRSKEDKLRDLKADHNRYMELQKKKGFALAKKYMPQATREELDVQVEIWWAEFGPGLMGLWQKKHPEWVKLQNEVYEERRRYAEQQDEGGEPCQEDD